MSPVSLPQPHNSFDEDTGRLSEASLQLPGKPSTSTKVVSPAAESRDTQASGSGRGPVQAVSPPKRIAEAGPPPEKREEPQELVVTNEVGSVYLLFS